MQFHIDIDHPGSISGWLLPDNPSVTPTLILSASGCPPLTMTANAHRPDVKSIGQHTTGLVGFLITEAIVPGLSGLKDFEIREAESNLLVYRRCRGLKRKVFCFGNATDPMAPLAARLEAHFTLYYDAVEQQPYDTIFALLNNQSAIAAISASEKPLAIRFITVAGLRSCWNASIASVTSLALRPFSEGSASSMPGRAAWQPMHELAPRGASAAEAPPTTARTNKTMNSVRERTIVSL